MPKMLEMSGEDLSYALRRQYERIDDPGAQIDFLVNLTLIHDDSPELNDHPEQQKAIGTFLQSVLAVKGPDGKLNGDGVKDFINQLDIYRVNYSMQYSSELDAGTDVTQEIYRAKLSALSGLYHTALLTVESDPLFQQWNKEHPEDKLTAESLEAVNGNIRKTIEASLNPQQAELFFMLDSKEAGFYAGLGIHDSTGIAMQQAQATKQFIPELMESFDDALDTLMNDPFEKMVQLGEKGDFHTLVREYVELSFKVGKGEATEEERKLLDAFDEYVQEPIGTANAQERETPKRSKEFLTGFITEMALYRSELLMESGKLAVSYEERMRYGGITGAELYSGNPEAMKDIADNMMNGTDLYAKTVITAAGIKLVSMVFTDTEISDEMAHKLGYEGLTIGDFIKKPMYDMMNEHANSMEDSRAMQYRERGESLMSDASLAQKYGLKPDGKKFQPVTADGEIPLYDLAVERNAKSAKALGNYNTAFEDIQNAARQQLTILQEMADKKSSNSAEFNAMLSALREVAEMNASLSSPKLIEGNINRLKEASKDYMERIDGSIFRGVRADGKARRDMAGSLSDLADTWNESLTKAADGKIGEYWPLGQQASELETNRKAVESAANAYHLSQQQIAAARAAQAAPTPTVASQPAPQAETIVSKPAAQAETIVSPPTATAETVIQKPVSKAQTIERPAQGPNRERSRTINLATMMKEQKAAEEAAEPAKASKNSVREEILKRRSEIYEKRRQNEEAGIVNDGKNQAKKQAGKGGM